MYRLEHHQQNGTILLHTDHCVCGGGGGGGAEEAIAQVLLLKC